MMRGKRQNKGADKAMEYIKEKNDKREVRQNEVSEAGGWKLEGEGRN